MKKTKYFVFKNKHWENFTQSKKNIKEYKKIIKIIKIINNKKIKDLMNNIKSYFLIIKLIILNFNNYLNIIKQIKKIKKNKNKIPYVIGITGSVAVGKTTLAEIITILLKYYLKKKITHISTDNFLYTNEKLQKKNILNKKGFPESYDLKNLINFLIKIKSGEKKIKIPKYSHLNYNIIKNEKIIINNPNILIIEGLNILQIKNYKKINILSDFVNFSIYINTTEKLLKIWYKKRILNLYKNRNKIKDCFFQKFNNLTKKEIINQSMSIWKSINKLNLIKNILPTKKRATLILNKTNNHKINEIKYKI